MDDEANHLQGYLYKIKSDSGTLSKFLNGSSNKRWFQIQAAQGADEAELTLCYFKNDFSKEPRSWVFLRDVNSVQEETIQGAVAMVIVHPSRTMKLKASSDQSTRSWIRRLQRIVQIQKDGHVLAEAKDEVSNEPKFESKEILSRAESASSATPPVLPPRLPPRDSGERPSEVWPSQARSSEAQPAEAKSSELHYLEDKARMMHPMATMPREALREVQSVNSMPHSMAPGKLENGNKANAGIYSNLPTETAMPSYRGKEDSDDEEPAVQMLATSVAPKPEVHVRREGFSSNAPSSSSAGAKPQARQGTDLSAKNSEEDSAAAIPEVAYSKPRRVRMADALIVEERAAPAMSEAKKCEVFDGDSSSEDEDALAAEKSRLKKKQAMAQAKQGARASGTMAGAANSIDLSSEEKPIIPEHSAVKQDSGWVDESWD